MHRCVNCLIPTTKPGVELNDDGKCQGCVHQEMRSEVDYEERFKRLERICDEHRRDDGSYDCLIPVSGGKDSHYQTYMMKEVLDMNPLLVAVGDPFTNTEAGEHNLYNNAEAFDCDLITVDLSPATVRKMVRIAFEEFGSPTWPVDRAIYCVPIQMGIDLDIPLIVYGENTSWEYGGVQYDHDDEEPYSAIDQIKNDVAKPVDFDLWLENGVKEESLNQMRYPDVSEIESAGLEPIYLSYFRPWDGYRNHQIAKNYGFRTIADEWSRDGFIESYDQIDSKAYLMNVWMKYPKMGYMRTTDVVGYRRRSDEFDITIEEGIELIREHDHKLDEQILDDFLDFTGYSDREFWEIVEHHRNEEIFDESFLESGTIPKPVDDFENVEIDR
jgi:N-acetyl sugar amidotransferase